MKNTEYTIDYYLGKEDEKRAKAREASRKYYEKNKSNLAANRSLTATEYKELLESQHGMCAICTTRPAKSRLCVDHNHETGETRGLLCRRCNSGLGHFLDDAVLLRSAITYLENYKSTTQ